MTAPTARKRVSAEPEGPAREAAFAEALAVLRERRDEFNEQGFVPRDYIDLLKKAGLYRASTPKRFGGDAINPARFLERIEAISEIDPATGWVASFGSAMQYFAAAPLETQAEVYADGPDVCFAGGNFPMQEAEEVEGGYLCTGKWLFGSGCAGADLIGVGIKGGPEAQGRPVMAVFPAEKVRIEVDWDVSGMRATGSNELHLDKEFVPKGYTFIRGGEPNIDEPLFRYPGIAYAAQVLAVTALGAARGALNYTREVGSAGSSITGGLRKGDRGTFQLALAQAEAKVRSARAFFYDETEKVFAMAESGEEITPEVKAILRLATSNLAHSCREAILICWDLAGTGAIYRRHPMQRFLQDGLVPAQHAMLQTNTIESTGAVLLGAQVTIPSFP